jgi:large conductance mechanosensitive channel
MQGFKAFLLRGNVVDLAVGVVVGAAFTSVVNGLVKDFLTPLIAAFIKTPDFAGLSFTVNGSAFMYGDFINTVISFLLSATAIYFFVVLPINQLVKRSHQEPLPDPTTKKCPECRSEIPLDATRCAFCTTKLS